MNELRQQPDASRESGRRPAAHHLVQPIAVDDALYYLAAAATADIAVSRIWDIGGPNVLRYQDMMRDFAEEAGLARRRLIPVPLISPTIGSRGVAFLTPLPLDLVRPLVESLRYDAVLKDRDIDTVIPPHPAGCAPTAAPSAKRFDLRPPQTPMLRRCSRQIPAGLTTAVRTVGASLGSTDDTPLIRWICENACTASVLPQK